MRSHFIDANGFFRLDPELIRRGAQGAVWKGTDCRGSQKRIAIKIYHPFFEDQKTRKRAETEISVLKLLDHHPHIVKYVADGIVESGEYIGRRYIATEYIEALTLTEWVESHPGGRNWPICFQIALQIADALELVHASGLIHRDVGGNNILIRNGAEVPQTKLIDFGVVTPAPILRTLSESYDDAGTRPYQSPEACLGDPAKLSAKSDVWGLGAVLYQMLTGELPFGNGANATIRLTDRIRWQPLRWPRGFTERCPSSVVKIVEQCLEKHPAMRPTSTELKIHLDGILNRRENPDAYCVPSPPLMTWLKVRPWENRITICVAAAVVCIITVVIWELFSHSLAASRVLEAKNRVQLEQTARLEKERLAEQRLANVQERDLAARRNGYAAALKLAQEALDAGNFGQVVRLLNEQRPPNGKTDLRGFEWYWLWHICHRDWQLLCRRDAPFTCVAWSSDGRTVASGGNDATVRLWDVETRQLLAELKGHDRGPVLSITFSTDGRLLATSGQDGTARLWHVPDRKLLDTFRGPGQRLGAVALSADSQILAAGLQDDFSPHQVFVWDITNRRQLTLDGLEFPVHSLAFSPQDRLLAVGTGPCVTWDTPCELLVYTFDEEWAKKPAPVPRALTGHMAAIWSVAFSSDGRTLISGSRDNTIRLWDPFEGRELRSFLGPGPGEPRVTSVAVSTDRATLVSVGLDAAVRVWNVISDVKPRLLRGHHDVIRSVAIAPNGRRVVTASDDGTLRLWNIGDSPLPDAPSPHEDEVMALAISPNSRTLATASGALSKPGDLKLFSLPGGGRERTLQERETRLMGIAFSPDGNLLATAGGDWNLAGRVDLWEVNTGKRRWTRWFIDDATREEQQEQSKHIQRAATSIAFSRDGRLLAAGGGVWGAESRPGLVRVWGLPKGETKVLLEDHAAIVRAVAFSPKDDLLATAGYDAVVRFWDTNEWQQVGSVNIEPAQAILAMTYSDDGSMLAVAASSPESSKSSRVVVYDAVARRELTTLQGHTGVLRAVTFSADGRRLATTGYDRTVRIWDPLTSHELAAFPLTDGGASAAFAHDGRYLAVGAKDGTVRIWDIGSTSDRRP